MSIREPLRRDETCRRPASCYKKLVFLRTPASPDRAVPSWSPLLALAYTLGQRA